MIGWISYIRICHKISSFENDWLNILIICHWISPFKNGCLDILIWEIVKGNSNVCRCYCSSLEPPDQTCLGFRILTTRCEECQNKRVFSLYSWISLVQYQPFSANLWTKCGTFIWERSVASIISLLCWNWGKLLSKMNWGQLLSNKNTPHPEALISRAPSHWPSEDATSRGPLRVLLHELEIVCNRAWWCENDFCCSGEGGICLYLISNCFPRSEKNNRISETRQDFCGVTGDAQTNRTSTRFPL